MGTGGPFPGGKERLGRDADHSPPSFAEVENEQELYLLSNPSAFVACSGRALAFRYFVFNNNVNVNARNNAYTYSKVPSEP
jgi:hypothetical protein